MTVDSLNACPRLRSLMPSRAFRAFATCAGVIGRRTTDGTLIADNEVSSTDRLDARHVVFTNGNAFACPDMPRR